MFKWCFVFVLGAFVFDQNTENTKALRFQMAFSFKSFFTESKQHKINTVSTTSICHTFETAIRPNNQTELNIAKTNTNQNNNNRLHFEKYVCTLFGVQIFYCYTG